MENINEISPVKNLAAVKDPKKVFEIADEYLPNNCFWREGEKINIEMLNFVARQYEQKMKISTETICFHCSVQYSEHYEDCSGKPFSFKHFD